MISRFFSGLVAVMLLQAPAVAQERTAEALVKDVTEEVLSILREDKEVQSNRARAIELIETRIAPHFDFDRMTALAVGRAWQKIEPPKREALATEFRSLLVRTYSNALAAYKDQTVSFKPTRPTGKPDEAVVHSQVDQPGAASVPIDYRLHRRDGKDWKVYDVIVNNVSLVTTYRGSFATELNSGGVDGLLSSLQARNRSVETPP